MVVAAAAAQLSTKLCHLEQNISASATAQRRCPQKESARERQIKCMQNSVRGGPPLCQVIILRQRDHHHHHHHRHKTVAKAEVCPCTSTVAAAAKVQICDQR